MFTGIVQAKGRIAEIRRQSGGVRLIVDRRGWQPPGLQLQPGDSVCISGVCLTLVDASCEGADGGLLHFDVIVETLNKTTLGSLRPGSTVNLEPSLTANTAMGGHFVQGHIDGVGEIIGVQRGEDWRVAVRPPADLMDYIVPKGSIAIDGISLTVASVAGDHFDVALIPTTLELTTLGDAAEGLGVNLETDIVSKTVVNFLRRREEALAEKRQPITVQTLRAAGFV